MSNLTADQLAADILARQGKPTTRGEHTFTEARLTAKQANYLFSLCEREGYMQERTHRWRHYRAASSPACWQVTEAMNGSALLSQTVQGGLPTDEEADQADALLDIWDAMHLQGIHDKLTAIGDQADALLEEYHANVRQCIEYAKEYANNGDPIAHSTLLARLEALIGKVVQPARPTTAPEVRWVQDDTEPSSLFEAVQRGVRARAR